MRNFVKFVFFYITSLLAEIWKQYGILYATSTRLVSDKIRVYQKLTPFAGRNDS